MTQTALSFLAACLLTLPGAAQSLTLTFATPAESMRTRAEALTSYMMPVGPFAAGELPTLQTEGALEQTAWRLDAPGLTTLQLLAPLRDQLTAAGYSVVYECEAAACGGFDFRYGTDVLPEPEMHVDLGDFRYLAVQRTTPDGPEYLSLIVSRAEGLGFVQVTRVDPAAQPDDEEVLRDLPGAQPGANHTPPTEPIAVAAPVGGLADRLRAGGAQVMADLEFESGSATLASGEFASLAELAALLRDDPQARVMLVGHTDASGALDANIALSRQRAQSVRNRLIGEYAVPARQVDAEGVGFLSPRAPNDTEAGRLANRRVEVMLLAPTAE